MGLDLLKFKPLLGIEITDDSQDTTLLFILEDVEQIILNYCNLRSLPDGLKTTAYRMAMDLYRNENVGAAEYAGGGVSSLHEGDVSVSYKDSAYVDTGYRNTLLKNYEMQLSNFRRLKW